MSTLKQGKVSEDRKDEATAEETNTATAIAEKRSSPTPPSRSGASPAKNKKRHKRMSCSSDDSDGQVAGDSAPPLNRLERKRNQEKRRRQEFKEALDSLHATLLRHDDDFRFEAQQREGRTGVSAMDGDNTMFNRVELVNQAIFTISNVSQHNVTLKNAIGDLKAGREVNPSVFAADSGSRRTGFHKGVGPLGLSRDQEEPADARGAARNNNASLDQGQQTELGEMVRMRNQLVRQQEEERRLQLQSQLQLLYPSIGGPSLAAQMQNPQAGLLLQMQMQRQMLQAQSGASAPTATPASLMINCQYSWPQGPPSAQLRDELLQRQAMAMQIPSSQQALQNGSMQNGNGPTTTNGPDFTRSSSGGEADGRN